MGGMAFFFSSRRRHTRSLCDWSSDVCSSDLLKAISPWCCPASGARTRSATWQRQSRHSRSRRPRRPDAKLRKRKPKHARRSEEHTSELQSHSDLVCRLLLEKKKKKKKINKKA